MKQRYTLFLNDNTKCKNNLKHVEYCGLANEVIKALVSFLEVFGIQLEAREVQPVPVCCYS